MLFSRVRTRSLRFDVREQNTLAHRQQRANQTEEQRAVERARNEQAHCLAYNPLSTTLIAQLLHAKNTGEVTSDENSADRVAAAVAATSAMATTGATERVCAVCDDFVLVSESPELHATNGIDWSRWATALARPASLVACARADVQLESELTRCYADDVLLRAISNGHPEIVGQSAPIMLSRAGIVAPTAEIADYQVVCCNACMLALSRDDRSTPPGNTERIRHTEALQAKWRARKHP